MPIKYKLTDKDDQTYGHCQWGEGVEYTTLGVGPLCSSGWLHVYDHPLIAVLLNYMHGAFNPDDMHLWECECNGEQKTDRGLKSGFTRVKTIKRIPVPQITDEQRILIGIFCAKKVEKSSLWNEWADNWVNKKERGTFAARKIIYKGSMTSAAFAVLSAVGYDGRYVEPHYCVGAVSRAIVGAIRMQPVDIVKIAEAVIGVE